MPLVGAREYDPDKHCGAHPDSPKGPCRAWKGQATNHPGEGRCKWHGGKSPNAVHVAEERREVAAARSVVERHALPRHIHPAEALLEEIARAAGTVDWLHTQLVQLEPDDLVWGKVAEKSATGAEGGTWSVEHRAQVNMWWKLWTEERDRLRAVSRETLAANIDERRVRLAESTGALLADVIRGILGDLNLSPEQQARVSEVVPRHLRSVASGRRS